MYTAKLDKKQVAITKTHKSNIGLHFQISPSILYLQVITMDIILICLNIMRLPEKVFKLY